MYKARCKAARLFRLIQYRSQSFISKGRGGGTQNFKKKKIVMSFKMLKTILILQTRFL